MKKICSFVSTFHSRVSVVVGRVYAFREAAGNLGEILFWFWSSTSPPKQAAIRAKAHTKQDQVRFIYTQTSFSKISEMHLRHRVQDQLVDQTRTRPTRSDSALWLECRNASEPNASTHPSASVNITSVCVCVCVGSSKQQEWSLAHPHLTGWKPSRNHRYRHQSRTALNLQPVQGKD